MAENKENTTAQNAGESQYGKRLSYEKKGCLVGWNDPIFAVLFYLHLLFVVVMVFLYFFVFIPGVTSDLLAYYGVSAAQLAAAQANAGSTDTGFDQYIGGIVIVLLISILVGSLWGIIWLKICEKFAEQVIKFSLFLLVGIYVFFIIYGLSMGSAGMSFVVCFVIITLFTLLYIWCIWARIPFSSALLSISADITQKFQGTIVIGITTIFLNVIWYIIWGLMVVGYIVYSILAMQMVIICNPESTSTFTSIFTTTLSPVAVSICTKYPGPAPTTYKPQDPPYAMIFLFALSFYWGYNLVKNIAHTTTCGVVAAWFFSQSISKPTMPALGRTMTTSFGSVSLGSLLVAMLQALRALIKSQGRTPWGCIALLLLRCIEGLVRMFNKYAFAQCAIYGTNFIDSAKATWALIESKGFQLIINDNITGIALFAGSMFGFAVTFGISFLMTKLLIIKGTTSMEFVYSLLIAFAFALLGFVFCRQILQVVESAIAGLFVCFAEDPAALSNNRPQSYQKIADSGKAEVTRYIQTGFAGENKPVAQNQA